MTHMAQLGVYFILFIALYFEVFLLISFFEKRPAVKTALRPKYYPFVSIIVPCWNEEKTLAGTIESLLALEYPKEKLSLIVVNDGSTDGTLSVARRFAQNSQVTIISREQGGEGKHVPLNMGLAVAQGDLIGCLDADSFVEKDALLESVKKFEESPQTMAVVPAMKVNRPRNPLELMQAVEYTFGIFYKKMFGNLSAISVLPGPFSLYRHEVFDKIGNFRRAHNTEDMEMAFRMHANGLAIENAHTAVVYTNVPRTLRALLRQRTRWSQGFLENSKDYRYMYFNTRFGYFGVFILPFLLSMFLGSLYLCAYMLYRVLTGVAERILVFYGSGAPLQTPTIRLDWFYIDTSMMTFLVITMLFMTLAAILLGRRIAGANFGVASLLSYFTLYGFVAPLWLARAAFQTAISRTSVWR